MAVEFKSCAFVLAALCSAPAFAGPPAPPPRALQAAPSPTVLTDVDAAGTIWARGTNWKMSFDTGHVTWVPRLGNSAPRSPRLDLTLRGVSSGGDSIAVAHDAAPVLDGTRVTIARGPLVERYDLAPNGVEQSFVLAAPLGAEDLSIEIGAATELTYLGRDAGLAFDADGRARVSYGDATVVDAHGAHTTVESRWIGDGIELRVPAQWLAQAAYPVVIDPLISNLTIDNDADVDIAPALAFTNGRFLAVYTDATSVLDRDIIARRFDIDGTFLDETAVDITSDNSFDPAVAGANNTFLVTWVRKVSLASDPVIRARSRTASTTTQGTTFDVRTGSKAEAHPDVGASPNAVTHPFFIVWQEEIANTTIVIGRGVSAGGTLAPVLAIETLNTAIAPRISSDAGTNGAWIVAFEEITATDQRLVRRTVFDTGTLPDSPFLVRQHAIGTPLHPDVDGDGNNWLIVYEDPDTNDSSKIDIVAQSLTFSPNHPQKPIDQNNDKVNLSKAELGPAEALSQHAPIVACEGCRFTYAYRGKAGPLATFEDLRTATVAIDPLQSGDLVFTETNTSVVSGFVADPDRFAIASTRFASPGRMLFAWDDGAGGSSDVDAQLRSVLGTGGITTVQTGCGAPEPLLAITGTPALGASIGISIIGTPTPLLAIGPVINVPICPGQAGCILGVQPLLLIAAPPAFSSPIPADPSFIGVSIGMQVIDLLPANQPGPSCGPPFYTQTFRVSDTKVLTFE